MNHYALGFDKNNNRWVKFIYCENQYDSMSLSKKVEKKFSCIGNSCIFATSNQEKRVVWNVEKSRCNSVGRVADL